jgi:hypothetical protein
VPKCKVFGINRATNVVIVPNKGRSTGLDAVLVGYSRAADDCVENALADGDPESKRPRSSTELEGSDTREHSFTEARKGSKGGEVSEKRREIFSSPNFVSILSFCENHDYSALCELCGLL